MRTALAGGLSAVALAACGASPVGGGSTPSAARSITPSATATPTPAQPQTFVLLVRQGSAIHARFVQRDGTTVGTVSLPDKARFPTVGGNRLWYVDAAHLHAVDAGGGDEDLGALGGMEATNPGWGGLAVSPDGTRWAWSYLVGDPNQPPMRSRLEIGGLQEQPHVALDDTQETLYLEPIAWTDAGIVVVDQPGNIGGFGFFSDGYWWTSRLLDPATGSTKTLSRGQGCPLSDVAPDGSFTCTSGASKYVALNRADGRHQLPLPGPIVQAGNALIDPSGMRVAVGIDRTDNTGQPDQQWVVDTVLIDFGGGGTTTIAHDGKVPVAWLADGSLVLANVVSPEVTAQNSVSILSPDLRTEISLGAGGYLGALDAHHALAGQVPGV